ncbi:nuclease [Patescibacteria group bacterium]|nr:nuclease [Patescibacteria group bacterium]
MRTKKILTIGVVLVLAGVAVWFSKTSATPVKTSNRETYEVKKVDDGDTLQIFRYGRSEKVRFIGIDTPETVDPRKPVQCFGKEASAKTKQLLTGKTIRIEFDPIVGERDKYDRLLAYVWLDSELINLTLLREGYAHEYTYRSQAYKYQSDFKQAEAGARQSEVGLWSPQTCAGVTK